MTTQTFATEREWLLAREESFGASEVPALFGVVSPRMDPTKAREKVIRQKAGLEHKPISAQSRKRITAGKTLEAYGLSILQRELGQMVVPCGFTLFRNPKFPFLAATPDAIVGGTHGAECKVLGPDALEPEYGSFAGFQGRWKWVDDAPLRLTLQTLAQMAAGELPGVHAIAVAGTDHKRWFIQRDEEVIELIGRKVVEAMAEVHELRAAKEKTA